MALAEFENATAWFNVLPQKNKSTNRVKSKVQSDNHHMQPACVWGGGGGGMQGFSNHKYEFCGKTDRPSTVIVVVS